MSAHLSHSRTSQPLRRLPWLLPASTAFFCWLVVCLPIIVYSQWFPLDLGAIFDAGANPDKWLSWILSPYNGSGRYFPVYWLYYTLPFPLFGMNAWPHLLSQSLLFVFASTIGAAIVLQVTRSSYLAAFAIVITFLSTATPENIATVGKAEVLAYLFCISALAIYLAKPGSFSRACVVSILFCLAIWTKETSLVLFAVPVGGSIVTTLFPPLRLKAAPSRPQYGLLFAALSVGLALSRIPYFIWSEGSKSNSYTSYTINAQLVIDNLTFYVTQQPDLFVFAFLSTFLLCLLAWGVLSKGSQFDVYLVFFLALCGAGWGYIIVLLIWRWPMAYYTLMPALFFRIAFVYSLFAIDQRSRLRSASIILATIASLYVLPYAYYIIQSQVAYSRIYTDAIKSYAQQPEGGDLVIENYPYFAEQVGGSAIYLRLIGENRAVKGIGDVLDPTPYPQGLLDILNVSQEDIAKNVDNMPKKGDYVLTFTGDKLATWFLRGVTPFYQPDTNLSVQAPYRMELVAQKEIYAPAIFINTWNWSPEARYTSLGYKLFRVMENEPRFLWQGHFLDGWIGRNASLQINGDFKGPVHLKASAPDFTLPNKLTITKDGKVIESIEFTSPDEIDLVLPVDDKESNLFEFDVERVMSPASIGMKIDKRPLGIRLNLVNEIP